MVNQLKDMLSNSLKSLRLFYKSNPPMFNKIIAGLDLDGRINLKEHTRKIVVIDTDKSPVHRVSFQPEIINKGKGRCLAASEIAFIINNYFDGQVGKYSQDLLLLKTIKSNELLSPISAERMKCRVNIKTDDKTLKGIYCSIPIIIVGKPSLNFKTNIDTIFEKSFKKVRTDQQLESTPFLAFRSFTRKKSGFKTFLTNEELMDREEYLTSAFL